MQVFVIMNEGAINIQIVLCVCADNFYFSTVNPQEWKYWVKWSNNHILKKLPNFSILYSWKKHTSILVAPHPHQHLVSSVFFHFSHSNSFVVAFNLSFNLYLPNG